MKSLQDEAFKLDEEDWKVLALFGRAMLSAQLLEFSIFELAQMERPPAQDIERALRRIEGLLKQPSKDQARGLRDLPESLRNEVVDLIDGRNRLAHDFLIEYRLNRLSTHSTDWAMEI